LDICLDLKADIYFSGTLGKNYLYQKPFEKEGIQISFQEYQHPVYSQRYPGFEPYMSVIDLLFNHGPNSLKIIKS
jgi:hypothetical protein